MSGDVRDLVREHIAAFNAHDTERLLAGFAADAVWLTGADRIEGAAELRELFDAGLWQLNPELAIRSLVIDGSRAAVELHESIGPDSERQSFDIAVFFEFADDRIRAAKVYREGSADL